MVINQANLFLVFTINGILIGLLFDIFIILRKSFRTSDIITYCEDLLFWILTGFLLLYSIFTFSNGEVRFYMFLAVFCGCLIYMLLFSKYFIGINVKIIEIIKKIVITVFSVIILPIKIVIKFFKKIFFKPINLITINIKKFNFNFLKNQSKYKKIKVKLKKYIFFKK